MSGARYMNIYQLDLTANVFLGLTLNFENDE